MDRELGIQTMMGEPTTPDLRITRAENQANAALADPVLRAPPPAVLTHAVVLGDPQASIRTVLAVLDHNGLLADDGWLHLRSWWMREI